MNGNYRASPSNNVKYEYINIVLVGESEQGRQLRSFLLISLSLLFSVLSWAIVLLSAPLDEHSDSCSHVPDGLHWYAVKELKCE